MTTTTRRVAVIGAGPSGAITTDALVKEQAFDTIRVFDRRGAIGGTWVYTPHLPAKIPSLQDLITGNVDHAVPIPTKLPAETSKTERVNNHQTRFSDSALHEHLHSNIIPSIMSFTREPFPDKLSERTLAKFGPRAPFRHREVVREWVQEIFVRNGNDKLLELNTTVERAVKNEQQEWVLTLRRETPGKDYWWEERFDALIVASGHYNIPWVPDIPGLVDFDVKFPGKILHSKHFRGPASFAGKRVVIVGGSISSHEVLHEILPKAKKPVFAALRGDPVPAFGWAPFTHPHIVVKNEITRFDSETGTLFFADGSYLNDVDHVIFGTGYAFSLPFLPDIQARIKQANRRLPGVFQHTFSIGDPSLSFVGMLGGGFTFRVYEWQAVAVARLLAGRARPLPSRSDQLEWEQRRVAELKGGKNYYSIASDYEGFFEYLRYIAGDPTPGTTGRVLPPFDKASLAIWTDMVATKIKGFEEDARKAELEIRSQQEQETHQRLQEIIGNWSPRAKL
ncbi:thiol-specific monooxygenase [Verticillium alfalfae VaMs.102]|uniref:Thiol-specific monooxygenase n=1 Tax=Verticillium alfalfae (strain VaMs.102 / ATCC MYA-4576 / FGSC 10136) TaxID=526221 RepID=C9SDT6_VERA1|nr:thiol-specific monooxygenase [Verticillium alfalfae VaMs.102]EEY17206.1 thiol-specific monooxygenase [Verticillium alfalfae VaMs.102]